MPSVISRIYTLIGGLPRCRYPFSYSSLPENGIYFFFENGETVEIDGGTRDRVVRIGSHRENGRFRGRIRQHYGHVNSLAGNKNASVFRKHLGGALMRKSNPEDPRLPGWLKKMGPSDAMVEEEVSRVLRDNFAFVCFRVDQRSERMALEAGLIALFAQHPLGRASDGWLGQYAAARAIRECGLWNTRHIESMPLGESDVEHLEHVTQDE